MHDLGLFPEVLSCLFLITCEYLFVDKMWIKQHHARLFGNSSGRLRRPEEFPNNLAWCCFIHILSTNKYSQVIKNKHDKTSGNSPRSCISLLTTNAFQSIMDMVPRGSESSKPGER